MYAVKTLTNGEGDFVWVNVNSPDYVLKEDRTIFPTYQEAFEEARKGMDEIPKDISEET